MGEHTLHSPGGDAEMIRDVLIPKARAAHPDDFESLGVAQDRRGVVGAMAALVLRVLRMGTPREIGDSIVGLVVVEVADARKALRVWKECAGD
jgi:hypothetical protein